MPATEHLSAQPLRVAAQPLAVFLVCVGFWAGLLPAAALLLAPESALAGALGRAGATLLGWAAQAGLLIGLCAAWLASEGSCAPRAPRGEPAVELKPDTVEETAAAWMEEATEVAKAAQPVKTSVSSPWLATTGQLDLRTLLEANTGT